MPKAEKERANAMEIASFVMSVVACILAIVMPYATYTWMQNEVRLQKIKATSLRAFSTSASGISTAPNGATSISKTTFIRIVNDGDLPIDQVEVIFEDDAGQKDFFEETSVTTDPYRKVRTELSDCTLVAAFEKPLPPRELVTLAFHKTFKFKDNELDPDDKRLLVWVRSEASPAIPIHGLQPRLIDFVPPP